MAAPSEGGGTEEIKTHFITREGTYKLMTLSEYSRPTRVAFNGQANTPVKVSFITLNDQSGTGDRICFNVGKELYFYVYKGVRKAADLTKPIDKRVYKGTFPTCHDFNQLTATADSVSLLVGFTAGQVQLIDPIKKELSKLYNEERLIDRSKVTCIKWIPGSPNQFLVSHSSGQLYVYSEELTCGTAAPHYQLFKQGENFSIHTCKTKSTRNPLYRWVIGDGCLNEFAFSPCARYIATVSQDGYLRIFNYASMELVDSMKSYFGGLLCVCWSPDGRYIVTGGEDDLVTVWSVLERRVVCRGQGHHSWVNVVSFDAHTTSVNEAATSFGVPDFSGSDDDFAGHNAHPTTLLQDALRASTRSDSSKVSSGDANSPIMSYRFASVGQDTMLCLWDLTNDVLRGPGCRHRAPTIVSTSPIANNHVSASAGNCTVQTNADSVSQTLSQKFATLALGERREDRRSTTEHKRNFSLGGRSGDKAAAQRRSAMDANHARIAESAALLLGSPACPRLADVELLEPLVSKRVAHERLTALTFRDDCLVIACQEGYVYTWARPGKVGLASENSASNTSTTSQPNLGSTAL